jgi:hypothetical protein
LAMPQKHPFWSAGPSALDAGPRPSGCLASADAGILATWSGTTRETRLHNARIGHPADIADHDYAATYGKLAYRSAFPFDLPTTAAGQAGADGAVVVIEGSGHVIHRNESVAGAAGPGWIRTRSLLPTTGAPTELTTVVLVLNPLEIRVTRVRPGVPVRLRESPATLGFAAADARDVRVGTNADGAWVADSDRTIAVRALLGYDVAGHAGARAGLANLVHERSITPFVEESASSAAPRVVAAVGVAVSRAVAPDLALAGVRLEARGSNVTIAWPGGAAFVAVGRAPERRITLGGLEFEGRRLHVLRVDRDHTTIMGERIAAITGVVTLDRPGAVSLTRDESGVEVTAASGVRLDQGWAGPGLIRCLTRLGVGAWQPAADLAEPGVVPDRLVRRIARAHGTRLVDLRLERAG